MTSAAAAQHDARADIHDAELRRRISPGALRSWFGIARQWALTDVQAARLLGTPVSTYRRWKRAPDITLDVGQMERLSLLLGIYKSLEMLLPRADAADGWIKQPNRNALFGGQTPLERMLAGHIEDLAVVRRHLDAERGGWA
ncbi:MbcA/ParS/Xre antitoxin family protein [uncultured Salinisphaera sp.]|uniref:MbcA/ParS/Xre antitoxin family protein n=1 Tax=uncultured Salinisphaera sp. TaxID=359372 RepID=UPI0032B1E75B|tara:strand:- start:443 stop:868 length:426 start_codon:yes stop_codon:yes gene_type:complete